MNTEDIINNLVKSYEVTLRKSFTPDDKDYSVKQEWLLQQYLIAFEEGVRHGMEELLEVQLEESPLDNPESLRILKVVLSSSEAYKDLASKVNLN